MATRKCYKLKADDKPIFEHLRTLFWENRVLCWSVENHDAWWLLVDPQPEYGKWIRFDFEAIKTYLRRTDPTRCDWDVVAKPKRTTVPRSALVAMLTRLQASVATVDPELAAEARETLEAVGVVVVAAERTLEAA